MRASALHGGTKVCDYRLMLYALLCCTLAAADEASCEDRQAKALRDVEAYLSEHSANITLLEPFGAEVRGLNLAAAMRSGILRHGGRFARSMEGLMSHVGVLVFREQAVMAPSEQVAASKLFGAGELHSTHGEHAKAGSADIFRLSSSSTEGIVGPGAEWHNDGSFATDVFSHAAYHIVKLPSDVATVAGTSFAHLGRAHDLLDDKERRLLRRMVSVNSNGGAVHPIIHEHPLSLRPSLFLHLAMTGAVVHVGGGGDDEYDASTAQWVALDEEEVASLLTRVSALFSDPHAVYHHAYRAGDLVLIDNWAVAHRWSLAYPAHAAAAPTHNPMPPRSPRENVAHSWHVDLLRVLPRDRPQGLPFYGAQGLPRLFRSRPRRARRASDYSEVYG